jgi:2,3,4,5-tetrahydropyridine-2-carboxylate N-succinyltransferase
MTDLQNIIDDAFDRRSELNLAKPAPELREAVEAAIELLDSGRARVAEQQDGKWVVNQWLKKAVLLYFGIQPNRRIEAGLRTFTTRFR